MVLKFKKTREDAIIPNYAKQGDAGLDLIALYQSRITDEFTEYGTGLAVEIPDGYVGVVVPRSSFSNYNAMLANTVGVIDSGYRGEILLRVRNIVTDQNFYDVYMHGDPAIFLEKDETFLGTRVFQLIVLPCPTFEVMEVDSLSSSERGENGFGSTGQS